MALLAAKDVVSAIAGLSEEEADARFRAKADELGIKIGDLMMPVRMAVTGSRVSPPLVGTIQILGVDKAVARIERTLKERF